MQPGMVPAADRPADQVVRLSNRGRDLGVQGAVADVTPVWTWAKVITAALIVVAGVLAFDLVVLWLTAGGLIERLPF
jgi:hypothetical protein